MKDSGKSETARLYRLAHRQERIAYSAEYRKRKAEEAREYRKRYYRENKERLSQKRREAYLANREKEIQKAKEWQAKQGAEYRKKMADYQRTVVRADPKNAPRILAWKRNYKAAKKNSAGTHTGADIVAIWERQGKRCAVPGCEYPISESKGADKYHVDHIRPLALGGSNWADNLQILCATHNIEKASRDEGAASLGMKLA